MMPLVVAACVVVGLVLGALVGKGAARLLWAVLLGVGFGFVGYQFIAPAAIGVRLENIAAENELLRTIKEKEPAVYAVIEGEIKRSGVKSQQEVLGVLFQHANEMIRRRLSTVSDELLREYAAATVEIMRQLENDGSDRCWRVLAGKLTVQDVEQMMTAGGVDKMQALVVKILKDPGTTRLVNRTQATQILNHNLEQLGRRYGKQLGAMGNPAQAATLEERRLFCRLMRDMLTELGKPDNTQALRLVFTEAQKR